MSPPRSVLDKPVQAPIAPAVQVPLVTASTQTDVPDAAVVEQIWCEALGVPSVESDDNFFDLGVIP